ncbi:head maturation protease, ClpP-related [Thomasclavelia cocleata]|uniref:head maturation protease, ClpP-related n=1 Tax=Thomasclavelia cocleata TaxID=69824 RepID=UPI0024317E07|nr:head maturation protease, ClpP-related [Thomasclavelia cocleata]
MKNNECKKFYEFSKISEDETELYIYGDITSWTFNKSDVSAFNFTKELSEIDTNLTVRINSYGGEVAEGLAIYSLLKTFKHKVTTVCDGFACSAASVIFMAGEKRIMTNASLLLIHNAWSFASGDANTLRKQADDLEKITRPSIEIYKEVSNLDEDTIQKMMDEETWITHDEALEWGFATDIQKNDAKQSINAQYHLGHEIMRNKELSKENKKLKKALSKFEDKKSNGWDAFFDTKN